MADAIPVAPSGPDGHEVRTQRGGRGRAWADPSFDAHPWRNPQPPSVQLPQHGTGSWHSKGALGAVSIIECSGSSTPPRVPRAIGERSRRDLPEEPASPRVRCAGLTRSAAGGICGQRGTKLPVVAFATHEMLKTSRRRGAVSKRIDKRNLKVRLELGVSDPGQVT